MQLLMISYASNQQFNNLLNSEKIQNDNYNNNQNIFYSQNNLNQQNQNFQIKQEDQLFQNNNFQFQQPLNNSQNNSNNNSKQNSFCQANYTNTPNSQQEINQNNAQFQKMPQNSNNQNFQNDVQLFQQFLTFKQSMGSFQYNQNNDYDLFQQFMSFQKMKNQYEQQSSQVQQQAPVIQSQNFAFNNNQQSINNSQQNQNFQFQQQIPNNSSFNQQPFNIQLNQQPFNNLNQNNFQFQQQQQQQQLYPIINNNQQQDNQNQQIQNIENLEIKKIVYVTPDKKEIQLQFEKNITDGNANKYIVCTNGSEKVVFAWNKISNKIFPAIEKINQYSSERYYEPKNTFQEVFLKIEGNQLVFTHSNTIQENKYNAILIKDIIEDNITITNYKGQVTKQLKLQLMDHVNQNCKHLLIINGVQTPILSLKKISNGGKNVYYETYTQHLGRILFAFNHNTQQLMEANFSKPDLTLYTSGLRPGSKKFFASNQNGQIVISDYAMNNPYSISVNKNNNQLVFSKNGQGMEIPMFSNEAILHKDIKNFCIIKIDNNQQQIAEQINEYFYEIQRDTDEYLFFSFNKKYPLAWDKINKRFIQCRVIGRANTFECNNEVDIVINENNVGFFLKTNNAQNNINNQLIQQNAINDHNYTLDLVSDINDYNNNKKFNLFMTNKQNGQQLNIPLNIPYKGN